MFEGRCLLLSISCRDPLLELDKGCSHPTVINDLCAECGADLQKDGKTTSGATIPMIHSIPTLKVSEEVSLTYIFFIVILITSRAYNIVVCYIEILNIEIRIHTDLWLSRLIRFWRLYHEKNICYSRKLLMYKKIA